MKRAVTIIFIAVFALSLLACGGSRSKQSDKGDVTQSGEQIVFQPPVPPALLTEEQQRSYMMEH